MFFENGDLILFSWLYLQNIHATFRVEINIIKIVTYNTNSTDQQTSSTEVINIRYKGDKIFSYFHI